MFMFYESYNIKPTGTISWRDILCAFVWTLGKNSGIQNLINAYEYFKTILLLFIHRSPGSVIGRVVLIIHTHIPKVGQYAGILLYLPELLNNNGFIMYTKVLLLKTLCDYIVDYDLQTLFYLLQPFNFSSYVFFIKRE